MQLQPHNNKPIKVVVYCASSPDVGQEYIEMTKLLGRLFSQQNIECVNGAGFKGLMGAINDSVIQHGGKTTGIIPRFMVDSGWCHTRLSETIITETMHERKAKMAEISDAAVALPGGVGTLEELMEIITWKQLSLYKKPIIILNVNGFYDPLIEMFNKMIDQKFLHPRYKEMWEIVSSPEEVINVLIKAGLRNPTLKEFNKKES